MALADLPVDASVCAAGSEMPALVAALLRAEQQRRVMPPEYCRHLAVQVVYPHFAKRGRGFGERIARHWYGTDYQSPSGTQRLARARRREQAVCCITSWRRWRDDFQLFNLFRYLTFRTGGAIMTVAGRSALSDRSRGIIRLAEVQAGRRASRSGRTARQVHLLTKRGTPTMGGSCILLSITISTLLWADLSNGYVWSVLMVTAGFGLVGFADDYRKLTERSHQGVSGRVRLVIEFALVAVAFFWI